MQGWAGALAGLGLGQGCWYAYIYISRVGAGQRQKMTGVPAGELGIPGLSSGAVCLFLRG